MDGTIKKKRKKHLRNLERNKSGREATVRMSTFTGGKNNERNFAAPTITFKGTEKARPQSFMQALNAGEVYEFNSKRRAERFAAGSWKKNKDPHTKNAIKGVMRLYRENKKSNG